MYNFYRVIHKLNIRVRHDREIYCLVAHDLGDVQVGFDMRILKKLEKLLRNDFLFFSNYL